MPIVGRPIPDFPRGVRLFITLILPTEEELLVTWLHQRYGKRMNGAWLRPDGSPVSLEDMENARQGAARRWDLQEVILAGRSNSEADLYTPLEIFDIDNDAPAEVFKAIGYHTRKLTPGAAPRCELIIHASLVIGPVIEYLHGLLAALLADYEPVSLSYTPLFEARELPSWLRSKYEKLLPLLQGAGGWQRDPFDRERRPAPLRLEGDYPCGAVFYLDKTTARDVTTWLTENWPRRESGNQWTWPTDYHHGRRYYAMPLQKATDQEGRVLLTAGIVEWEANHPDPLSVFLGPLGIPNAQGDIVQDNPRALEILVIQAGADLVQVEARCNALLLLRSFTELLRAAKTAYRDRLRLVRALQGIMDAGPPSGHEMMDAYFTARAEEFDDLIGDLEPAFAIGQAARADGPDLLSTGAASEPASDGARADGPSTTNARKAERQRKVKEYRERGMTIKKIAESLYAGESTIKADMKELGLSKPRSKT